MSLSPLVSFKSRFVTYLLKFPRISKFRTCDWFARRNGLSLEITGLGRSSSWHYVVYDIGTPIGTESGELNGQENTV